MFLFFSFLSLRQGAEEVHSLSLTYGFLDTWLGEKLQRTAERGLREEIEGEGLQSQKHYYSDRSRKINYLWNCFFNAFFFSQRHCFLTVIRTWEISTSLSVVWCWTFYQGLIFYLWKVILRKNMKLCLIMEPFDKKVQLPTRGLFYFFLQAETIILLQKGKGLSPFP